jgi:hypothetical protein
METLQRSRGAHWKRGQGTTAAARRRGRPSLGGRACRRTAGERAGAPRVSDVDTGYCGSFLMSVRIIHINARRSNRGRATRTICALWAWPLRRDRRVACLSHQNDAMTDLAETATGLGALLGGAPVLDGVPADLIQRAVEFCGELQQARGPDRRGAGGALPLDRPRPTAAGRPLRAAASMRACSCFARGARAGGRLVGPCGVALPWAQRARPRRTGRGPGTLPRSPRAGRAAPVCGARARALL